MPTIRVTVLRDDEPVQGHRVVLEFAGLIGTMSDAEYTDEDGIAEFEVESGQSGVVYVDGKKSARWGASTATDITVSL